MSKIGEIQSEVEEFMRAPRVLGILGLCIALLLVGCFLPFLLATVPLLGMAIVIAAALPLKWLLGKLLTPRWVGIVMGITAIVLLTKPAIYWFRDVVAMFPESKASAQEPTVVRESLKPWYTDRKNCHLFSRKEGDTGKAFAGRSTCSLSETADLYCQCADYQITDPTKRSAEIDYQHYCSVVEQLQSGTVTSRHERVRYNRFDSAQCKADAIRYGQSFYCGCR
jgi:hypothetical protein